MGLAEEDVMPAFAAGRVCCQTFFDMVALSFNQNVTLLQFLFELTRLDHQEVGD